MHKDDRSNARATTSYFSILFIGRLERCGENFVKVGCFNDNTRPLPELLLNKRNQLVRGWKKWKEFLEGYSTSTSCGGDNVEVVIIF